MPVHIANTNFEFELKKSPLKTIEETWAENPLCLQLQFLPLLYAAPDEIVAVTGLPSKNYLEDLTGFLNVDKLPHLALLQEEAVFQTLKCLSWGPSIQIQNWALHRNMEYTIPQDWTMIQKINSKAFSFNYCPLNEAALIENFRDLENWLNTCPSPKVLKNCFGLSGLGHLPINETTDLNKIKAFCTKEWNLQLPVIGEPWLDRVFDFSTQWFLFRDGTFELFGTTVFETRPNGRYTGTLAGEEKTIFGSYLPFLHEHIHVVEDLLKELAGLGYFGHVGIDALLYSCKHEGKIKLYPIVEINGRQTLSLAALRLQKTYYSNRTIRLSFHKQNSNIKGLLPVSLGPVNFPQNLIAEEISG